MVLYSSHRLWDNFRRQKDANKRKETAWHNNRDWMQTLGVDWTKKATTGSIYVLNAVTQEWMNEWIHKDKERNEMNRSCWISLVLPCLVFLNFFLSCIIRHSLSSCHMQKKRTNDNEVTFSMLFSFLMIFAFLSLWQSDVCSKLQITASTWDNMIETKNADSSLSGYLVPKIKVQPFHRKVASFCS